MSSHVCALCQSTIPSSFLGLKFRPKLWQDVTLNVNQSGPLSYTVKRDNAPVPLSHVLGTKMRLHFTCKNQEYWEKAMFQIVVNGYTLSCFSGGLPEHYAIYREKAKLVDEIDLKREVSFSADVCFLAVQKGVDWPFLIVAQKYAPSGLGGSYPQALVIPETDMLFLGAGERVLTYRLAPLEKVGQGSAEHGFHTFERSGEYVIMSAELAIGVWTIQGKPQWSQFVEPPWTYRVEKETMSVDVMGHVLSFPLPTGPGPLKKLWWLP
jgi:hypothetical protein